MNPPWAFLISNSWKVISVKLAPSVVIQETSLIIAIGRL